MKPYTPDEKPLYTKYRVFNAGDNGEILDEVQGFTFTIRLPDPHARKALFCYSQSVKQENPGLSKGLIESLLGAEMEILGSAFPVEWDECDLAQLYAPEIENLSLQIDNLKEEIFALKNPEIDED